VPGTSPRTEKTVANKTKKPPWGLRSTGVNNFPAMISDTKGNQVVSQSVEGGARYSMQVSSGRASL
jgi:hypothetical protein